MYFSEFNIVIWVVGCGLVVGLSVVADSTKIAPPARPPKNLLSLSDLDFLFKNV